MIQDIPLRVIEVGSNVRVDPGELDELAASIRFLGVLQPVKVTAMLGGRYRLVWGQRRVLASRQAGLETIPAIVVAPDGDLTAPGPRRSIEQLAENLHRRNLNPIETAEAMRDAIAGRAGTTQAELGRQLGIHQVAVSRLLSLLELVDQVQEHVRAGSMNVAQARALLSLPRRRQAFMARRALRGNWPAAEIERRVGIALRPPAPKRAVRGRPRIIELPPLGERSRSVAIPIRTNNGQALVTIGVEGPGFVDLVVEDGDHRIMLTLRAADARLIGRRLQQAYDAVAS